MHPLPESMLIFTLAITWLVGSLHFVEFLLVQLFQISVETYNFNIYILNNQGLSLKCSLPDFLLYFVYLLLPINKNIKGLL